MSLGVFISHSVGEVEIPLVNELSAVMTGRGVTPYLAMHDRQVGVPLSTKVRERIDGSTVVVAVITSKGADSAWVHEEVGYALGKGLKVLPFVEQGVDVKGMLEGEEAYIFDPSNPHSAVERMCHDLVILSVRRDSAVSERKAQKAEQEAASARVELEKVELVVALVLAAVIIMLLLWALSED